MITIVDDDKGHLEELTEAARREGIPEERLRCFDKAEDAWRFIRDTAGGRNFPFAVVSDWQLGAIAEHGASLLRNTEEVAKREGSGVWTFLITGHPETWFAREEPWRPFSMYSKLSPEWPDKLAKDLAALLKPDFGGLDRDNDFAPLVPCPLVDRIYLYSSGGARLFSPDGDGGEHAPNVFQLRSEHDKVDTVIVMYRGRHIVTGVSAVVARALLRWRTLWRDHKASGKAEKRFEYIKDMYFWERRGDGKYHLAEEDPFDGVEMRLLSLHNEVAKFHYDERIKKLGQRLFGEDFLPALPQVSLSSQKKAGKSEEDGRSESGKKVKEAVTYDHERLAPSLNRLPAPLGLRERLADSFMTRLHFVMTEKERDIHLRWSENRRELAGLNAPAPNQLP